MRRVDALRRLTTGVTITMVIASGICGQASSAAATGLAPVLASPRQAPRAAPASSMAAPAWAKVERASKASLKVWWAKVPGASGYVVYRWESKKKRYVSVKTLSKPSATSWVDLKRKTGKKYSYKVAAYKLVGGNKVVGAQSYWVSAVPYKKNAKVVNAGQIKASSEKTWLLGQFPNILPSKTYDCPPACGTYVKPSKASRAKNKRVIDPTLRAFVVYGKERIRVDKDGYVVPLKAGTAKVRLVAHNGSSKTISVEVVDFSRPTFEYGRFPVGSPERILLHDNRDQLVKVSSLAQQLALDGAVFTGGFFSYDESGRLICEVKKEDEGPWQPCPATAAPASLWKAIDDLLTDFQFPMRVRVEHYDTGPTSQLTLRFTYWHTPELTDGGVLLFAPSGFLVPDASLTSVAPGWLLW